MKKAQFIKKVLKSKSNTVFVTEAQVETAIEVFEKLGMFPPRSDSRECGHCLNDALDECKWEVEDEN